MRYKFSKKIDPKVGDERVVEKFLLFPKVINEEMRWLETVKILQKYSRKILEIRGEFCCKNKEIFVWKDIRFVDDL